MIKHIISLLICSAAQSVLCMDQHQTPPIEPSSQQPKPAPFMPGKYFFYNNQKVLFINYEGSLENLYQSVHSCDDDAIVVLLDSSVNRSFAQTQHNNPNTKSQDNRGYNGIPDGSLKSWHINE